MCADWEVYLQKYQDLAKEHNICIVPGTIVQLIKASSATFSTNVNGGDTTDADTDKDKDKDKDTDILINVAYFISNTGAILGKYQKKNLWHPERPHLTSSTSAPHETITDTPLGPVGLLICWDLAFPEAFRELIASGAKTIIIPTFWTLSDCSPYGLAKNPLSEKLFLESVLAARAFENTCCVVFVNAGAEAGKAERGNYAGLSRVCVPFSGALKGEEVDIEGNTKSVGEEEEEVVDKLDGGKKRKRGAEQEEGGGMRREEGMSIVEVDMEDVEEAEKNYKVREDIQGEGWHYTYRHQSGKL